jgi:hypothetical protein
MSLKNWEIVSITINLQNFREISVSYVVWSMEMSLTEIEHSVDIVSLGIEIYILYFLNKIFV